jgi:vacuolar protein sorting-associated protein 13A/C
MLEGLVANLLNRFLGMYVQNFDPKQLNVGIWSGDVKLRNLELRREALDQLRLPLNVVEGHLGSLTLSIPWSNLRGKPLKINIEDVYLLAAPKEDADYNAEEEDRRAHAVKMEKLDSAELLKERNTEGMSAEEEQKNQSFTASMVTAIVDNVQVTVKNIHIRYEDSISDPGHPFALGITLADFSAISTDENWKPTFIQGGTTSTHKLATLGSLAVYWDTDTKLIGTGKGSQSKDEQEIDHDDFIEKLRGMIVRGENPDLGDHQFILKPISGRMGLEMDKTGKPDRPKMKARLLFDELGFIVDEDQYRDALMLVDLFHYFIRHQEYKRFQPKSSPKEDPAGWLRFAGQAVLDKIHDRNRRWSWEYFKERRDDRKQYIELFKKKKREEKLTPTETEDLDKLERKLTYEDLRFWRSLARNQLRKENVGVKKPPPKQGWGSWIWGSKQEENTDDNTQMSEEQRKELYDAIAWDEKKAIAESVDMPREYVKMEVNMSLRTGSFTLKRDPHGKKKDILRLLFDSFSTQFLQRTDSMFVKVALEGMRLYDGTTEGSLFEQIITIKDAPPVPEDKRIEELNDDETSKEGDEDAEEEEKEDPFFQLSFENNPLDGSADTALTMKLKGMEFVYNPKFVVEVAKFFKPPERHMESIGALMETAGATVEGIRQQTRAGLEFALTEHKTINAQLDLQAPLIIIPDSVTKKSSNCLILDAGHISVTSELVDKDTLHDIQSKQKHQYTEADYRRLEGLMYDKFLVKLSSTQVLIGPSIEDTRAQLTEAGSNLHIVDRINMDFKVEICIIPKASDLTKFRVSGNLPVLHASISDAKYKNLMKLIDVAVPKFNDDEPSKQVVEGAKGPSNLKPTSEAKPGEDPLGRPRSKSFQFAAQEHDLVVEDDGDSAKDEKFEDATESAKTTPDVNLHQRNFEFNFTVDKLQGSLFKTDTEGKKPDQLLVELVAEHFDLHFYQEPFNMVAEVSLRSLAVVDHVEQNPLPEFRNLITSEDASAEEQKDLFSLKFVKVNKESPEFQTKYEGIAMNLDVAVSTINLIVTRKTLLTLLDFVLLTFTNPGPPQNQEAQISDKPEEQNQVQQASQVDPDKIRIRAELKRIAVILNNDGIRLATLSLSSGDVGIFLNGKAMRIGGRLGSLSLIDDVNQGVPEESPMRQLVTIEGQNLAEFKYETFDSEAESYPGYDMSIALKTGSIKINFLTEPFRKIMEFAVKFGKMQAIFNAARQAATNQATQIQQRATKMQFDIVISTPIVVFPRMVISDKPDRDTLTANLGEIYAKNSFVPLDDSEGSDVANKISAGIRNIKLTSKLHYEEDQSEELELIDKVDLEFNITMVDHKPDQQRPDLEIQGSMSNINLRLTPEQMKFALELSRTIPGAFATEADEVIEEDINQELPASTTGPARRLTDKESPSEESPKDLVSTQGPELHAEEGKWTKLDLVFKVGAIGLELVQSKEGEPVGDVEAASLSKFSLNETHVKLRMISDGALEAELVVQSFTIRDSRAQGANKFRKIMSLINNDVKQQFMASVSISGGQEKNLIALLTIDSPRMILALDYLFALQAFANAGLATDEPLAIENEAEAEDQDSDSDIMSPDGSRSPIKPDATPTPDEGGMNVSFRVNLVDAQVVLIANPAIASSEAIVLGTKQVLVSKQQAMTLQVDKVGMFLCRMDRFETSRLRILDDFSIQTALDIRNQGTKSSLTSITVDIEPLVLRLSLRDILLAMQIVNRASAMSGGNDDKKLASEEPQKIKPSTPSKKPKSTAGKAASSKPGAKSIATKRSSQHGAPQQPPRPGSAVLKREEMNVNIEGIRVVLIGDVHEMPMIDWRVKKFGVDVRDWSGAMTADTSIDTLINVYNFSKSAWEPLIEPWQLGFHMAKDQNPDRLAVDLYSRKAMELTISAATIALASKSFDFLTSEEDILSKPRGNDAPYRIRNYTGFNLDVWAEGKDQEEGYAAKLEEGDEQPWRFEDASATRESLSTDGATGVLGIRLEGSGFDSIPRIPVHREGEFLYNLKPKQDRVQHRILVEVKLGPDNVKNITFRSPLLLENNTQIPIELGIYSPEEGHLLKIEKVAPGDARPAPVGAAFLHSIVVRPDQGFGYAWSNERLHWKDLLKRPTRTITCRGEQDEQSPPFYFQLHASYDKKDPLTNVYPYMRLRLGAPVEVQNLLPYDFKYRIYDSNTKKDWTNFLRKGGVSPVHVVELSHLLLISVEMQDTAFKASKFGIINSTDRESFRREKTLELKDANDLTLHLNMHF